MEKAVPGVKQDVPVMARFLSDEMTDKDRKRMEREHPKKRKPLPRFLKIALGLSLFAAFSVLALFGVNYLYSGTAPEDAGTPEEAEAPAPIVSDNELKASGTVVIVDIDRKEKKIRFRDPVTDEEYVLNYVNSTVYEDPYGNPMVSDQLKTGDIVDILVSVHSSDLSYVKQNHDEAAFSLSDITDYDISVNKGIFSYDGRNYRILKGCLVMSGDSVSSFKEIKKGDVLSISGIGSDIYTLKQTGGNGYVRITGAESFTGGWIELGNIIRPIEDDMIMTVPEGNYTMNVTYRHYGGTKEVAVVRGKETRVDVSDLKGDLLKTGKITFSFEPVEASPAVYIDGKLVIKEKPVELDYGVHTLDIKAEGYVDIHKYLKVGQPMANLAIVLEEDDEDTASANSSDRNTGKKAENSGKSEAIPSEALPETFRNNNSENRDNNGITGSSSGAVTGSSSVKAEDNAVTDDTETVTTDVSQLYIDGPEGAEVYYDGAYKGVAPCHFKKNGGTHVITLMQNGHETKSYTLNLSSGTENESYSFNELIEEHDG